MNTVVFVVFVGYGGKFRSVIQRLNLRCYSLVRMTPGRLPHYTLFSELGSDRTIRRGGQ